jgi:hypothetical protein
LNWNLDSQLRNSLDKEAAFSQDSASLKRISNQAEDFPPLGSSPLPDPVVSNDELSGEKKEELMHPLIQLQKAIPTFVVSFVIACFAFSSTAQAVSPPPDGGYPGGNTAEGTAALRDLTTGTFNTAVGNFSLTLNTEGNSNTGVGSSALRNNTTGTDNTAVGADALNRNISGGGNTANGSEALKGNTTGTGNTAVGAGALLSNTEGIFNTAIGSLALTSNIGNGEIDPEESEGNLNTAVGSAALLANTTGTGNTAVGAGALGSNDNGDSNTAVGVQALNENIEGFDNTAVGTNALQVNTEGFGNTAVGNLALNSLNGVEEGEGSFNTAIGDNALANTTTGDGNVAVGQTAGFSVTTGTFNTFVGAGAGDKVSTASGVICIGESVDGANISHTCFIGNIFGKGVANGAAVMISENGRLGTTTSSRRFKDEIKPMEKASETLFALKPVTFRYKKEIDSAGIAQFGLVAEEVEKVNPDLVVRDKEGKPYSVRYEQVNAMLLNEFLKEHREVQELKTTVAQQRKDFEEAVAHLTTQVQKVSAQLELSKTAPQTVLNDQ